MARPNSHTVYSKSGRRAGKRLGHDDKGRNRDSSMGKDIRRGGRFQRIGGRH